MDARPSSAASVLTRIACEPRTKQHCSSFEKSRNCLDLNFKVAEDENSPDIQIKENNNVRKM